MHGISKEILKLVRASSMLHSIVDRAERSKASFLDKVDRKDSEYDTDAIYFELLRDIGRTLELRVIVDIVAGASAGGINGTMLARALSHDLPMGALRDLWLDHADVSDLLAPHARACGQQASSQTRCLAVGGHGHLGVHQGSRGPPQTLTLREILGRSDIPCHDLA
jgi:hypothetical protein